MEFNNRELDIIIEALNEAIDVCNDTEPCIYKKELYEELLNKILNEVQY